MKYSVILYLIVLGKVESDLLSGLGFSCFWCIWFILCVNFSGLFYLKSVLNVVGILYNEEIICCLKYYEIKSKF